MSDETTDDNVVDIDKNAARRKLSRHKTKLQALAITGLAGTAFVLGRRSRDVRVDVDYVPDESPEPTKD